MTIWTFKRSALALALLALSACEMPTGNESDAFKAATLMGGALFVEPPTGYCVDPISLRRNFALMARCDTLGGAASRKGALGLLTVSVAPMPEGVSIEQALPQMIREGETYIRAVSHGSFRAVLIHGKTPTGTDARHWRGLTSTGDYMVQLSAFGPEGGPMAGRQGAQLLALLSRQVAEVNRREAQ